MVRPHPSYLVKRLLLVLFDPLEVKLTLGLRPGFPLPFLTAGFFGLLERASLFSGITTWASTFTRLPLFLDSSSGWMRGRTPPLEMVTPFRSWRETENRGVRRSLGNVLWEVLLRRGTQGRVYGARGGPTHKSNCGHTIGFASLSTAAT